MSPGEGRGQQAPPHPSPLPLGWVLSHLGLASSPQQRVLEFSPRATSALSGSSQAAGGALWAMDPPARREGAFPKS